MPEARRIVKGEFRKQRTCKRGRDDNMDKGCRLGCGYRRGDRTLHCSPVVDGARRRLPRRVGGALGLVELGRCGVGGASSALLDVSAVHGGSRHGASSGASGRLPAEWRRRGRLCRSGWWCLGGQPSLSVGGLGWCLRGSCRCCFCGVPALTGVGPRASSLAVRSDCRSRVRTTPAPNACARSEGGRWGGRGGGGGIMAA